jgi:osmotically inducible protein OsmC
MNVLQNVAYTAKATATGGREGIAKSDDDGQGTNPEQLFAAGYAACFIGALKFVAGEEKTSLSKDIYINSEVSIGAIEGGFGIAVKLAVSLGDMDKAEAQIMVDKAHKVCPYSNATRGNIDVTLSVI